MRSVNRFNRRQVPRLGGSLALPACFVLCLIGGLRAAELPEADWRVVRRYVDNDVVAINQISVEAVGAFFELAQKSLLPAGRPAGEDDAAIGKVHDALLPLGELGVRRYYVVVSLADLPATWPFIVVPVESADKIPAVRDRLTGVRWTTPGEVPKAGEEPPPIAIPALVEAVDGGILICWRDWQRRRLATLQTSERDDLRQALAEVADRAAGSAIGLSDDQRRVVRELCAGAPPVFGDVTAERLVGSVRWAAVGVDMPPKLCSRVVVCGADAASAQQIKSWLELGLVQVEKFEAAHPELKAVTAQAKPLVVAVDGDRAAIELDQWQTMKAMAYGALAVRAAMEARAK